MKAVTYQEHCRWGRLKVAGRVFPSSWGS